MVTHRVNLYHKCRSTPGWTTIPKIKYEHIDLTNYSKMRVDLATNVMKNFVIYK